LSLLPRTTVELLPGSPPSWDVPSINSLPTVSHTVPVAPSHPPLSLNSPPISASFPSPSTSTPVCAVSPSPLISLNTINNNINQNLTVPHNTIGHLDQNTILSTIHNTPVDSDQNTILPSLSNNNDHRHSLPAIGSRPWTTLHPSTIDPPPIPIPNAAPSVLADPPLRHLTRLCFPYSCAATLDGLLPNL
jgi:hypothetical protein